MQRLRFVFLILTLASLGGLLLQGALSLADHFSPQAVGGYEGQVNQIPR